MKIHEATGDSFVPTKQKNLPNRILRAIDAAMHASELPRRLRPTLAELARFVSQDRPFETIFAKKETIATRTHSSVETIYRHLSALRSLGLIETLEQERKSRNGRYAVARIRFTRKCAELLGFVAPAEPLFSLDTPCPVVSAFDAAPPADMARKTDANPEVIHTPPHGILTVGHTLTEPTISKSQPIQRYQNGLPIDLTWLTRNGLSRSGIFKLMGLAKSAGKLLSDVVTAVRDRLDVLKGARLYAYLQALASGPTDFSVTAANARRAAKDAEHKRLQQGKVALFRQRFRGSTLTNRSFTRLYVIDQRCEFAQAYSRERSLGCSPLHDLREWITGVETGALVLATLATERQFAIL